MKVVIVDSSGRLVVDPVALAAEGRDLEGKQVRSLLSSTLGSAQEAASSMRGGAAEAWRGLLDDWAAQSARHVAQGEQLSDGLAYAARAYAEADGLNADELGKVEAAVGPGAVTARSADILSDAAASNASSKDTTSTPYGELGQWMLQKSGEPANWLGLKYQGKQLNEPVNVILVDQTSRTPTEAAAKLNRDLAAAGFPGQPGHSGGYHALVEGTDYPQQPNTYASGGVIASLIGTTDHGRVFGPAPGPDGGYVWTAALSREQGHFPIGLLTGAEHTYVSFDKSRDAFASALVSHGAVDLGKTAMGNVENTSTATTADHDGYAATILLN